MTDHSNLPPPYERFDQLPQNSQQAWKSVSPDHPSKNTSSSRQQAPQVLREAPENTPSELATMIWLCPHRGIDFAEAKTGLAMLAAGTSKSDVISLVDCVKDSCTENIKSQLNWSIDNHGRKICFLLTTIKLLGAPLDPDVETVCALYFTNDRVSAALQGLDLPLCAHLLLNHSFVRRKFIPNSMLAKNK